MLRAGAGDITAVDCGCKLLAVAVGGVVGVDVGGVGSGGDDGAGECGGGGGDLGAAADDDGDDDTCSGNGEKLPVGCA